MFDIAVIGGGVIGGMILRELSSYKLNICMLEKEADICMGASSANSGIVHAGFDALNGTNKAKYNVLGSEMMPQICKELGVKYKNNGSLVVAFTNEDMVTLEKLLEQGKNNGVKNLRIIDKQELNRLEPNISENAISALFAESGGIVCPYELSIASIGNAMDNGAKLFTDFEVYSINKNIESNTFVVKSKDGKTVECKTIINCAGLYSDKIANMVGDNSFSINARKGEYILLDKNEKYTLNHTLFFCPTEKGKGILVTKTVDGNILLGPTAENTIKDDVSTTLSGIDNIKQKANEMCKNLPMYDTVTSFAGDRAYSDKNDFIIERSSVENELINVAGIESPGLSASPMVAKKVVEIVGNTLKLIKKNDFNPLRKPDYFFKNLSDEEKNEVIKKDSNYGKIVCRCENITKGEILRAIRENPKATTVDGIKRRTRAGMGRCQGGFCQPVVAEILSKELNISLDKVTKKGGKSFLLEGKTK